MRVFSLILICGILQDSCAVSKIAQEIEDITLEVKKIAPKVMRLYLEVVKEVKKGNEKKAGDKADEAEGMLSDVYTSAQCFLEEIERGVKIPPNFQNLRDEILKTEVLISKMMSQAQASVSFESGVIEEILQDSKKLQKRFSDTNLSL